MSLFAYVYACIDGADEVDLTSNWCILYFIRLSIIKNLHHVIHIVTSFAIIAIL